MEWLLATFIVAWYLLSLILILNGLHKTIDNNTKEEDEIKSIEDYFKQKENK